MYQPIILFARHVPKKSEMSGISKTQCHSSTISIDFPETLHFYVTPVQYLLEVCQTTVECLAPLQGVAPVAGLHKAGSLLLQENCHPPPPPPLLLCLLNGPQRGLRGTARNCRLCDSPGPSKVGENSFEDITGTWNFSW